MKDCKVCESIRRARKFISQPFVMITREGFENVRRRALLRDDFCPKCGGVIEKHPYAECM